jgi:hypothetical protein
VYYNNGRENEIGDEDWNDTEDTSGYEESGE